MSTLHILRRTRRLTSMLFCKALTGLSTNSTPTGVANKSIGLCWFKPIARRSNHCSASCLEPKMEIAFARFVHLAAS